MIVVQGTTRGGFGRRIPSSLIRSEVVGTAWRLGRVYPTTQTLAPDCVLYSPAALVACEHVRVSDFKRFKTSVYTTVAASELSYARGACVSFAALPAQLQTSKADNEGSRGIGGF